MLLSVEAIVCMIQLTALLEWRQGGLHRGLFGLQEWSAQRRTHAQSSCLITQAGHPLQKPNLMISERLELCPGPHATCSIIFPLMWPGTPNLEIDMGFGWVSQSCRMVLSLA